MTTSILATKLYVPRPRPNLVFRSRLTDRLNAILDRKLTIISAPVGFGKTTLVSEWVRANACATAWLSLDDRDNDPARFLTYLIAALQTIDARVGQETMALLHTQQPQAQPEALLAESILTPLLNEIASVPSRFVLVLDDYHVIHTQAIDAALSFLIEHSPPEMHVVMTTREDPQLPLGRIRAQGELIELRAADLRFTTDEAAEFLNQRVGLKLSSTDIATLEARTEGWIAGLQLATLTMQGRDDLDQFVQAFAGDNRYIVDYLVEEVLQRQPEAIRNFLLQTAILDRLSGPLCDAVTGQNGAQARLEALERGNFFVVALDDKRQWYRYHHLFGEVLATHLRAEQPHQIAILHRRASEWYAQQGLLEDAIRYALAAKDFERAADWVELAVPAMRQSRQEATLLNWFKSLPDDVLCYRPVLSVHYAGALLLSGQQEGVEQRLRDAEQWLDNRRGNSPTMSQRQPITLDQAEYQQLPALISMYRAAQALARGDVSGTMRYAQRTLDLAPAEAHVARGAAAGLLGLAYWTSGQLEDAHRSYAECLSRLQKANYISDTFGCAIALADIRIAQGRLHDAMRTYEQARERGESMAVMRGMADIDVGLSEIYRERNELTTALQHLQQSKALGEHAALPQNRYRWCVAMARIREAEGELDDALRLLDEAERVYVGDFFPNVRPIAALRARVWLAHGRLGEAIHWVRERGLSIEDDLSYLREFEHITLARVLLEQAKAQDSYAMRVAVGLLDRLLLAAEQGERTHSVIEILVLLACAHHELGNADLALAALQRALVLAEPEGYIRIFVDEGQPMQQLLRRISDTGKKHKAYLQKILAAFGPPNQTDSLPVHAQPLPEPLSQREIEVLRLLNTELSGPEIASELVVALSTVRTYTKSIYGKLAVNSRRAAVRRAIELGLM